MKRILSIVLSVCLIFQAVQILPRPAQAYPATDAPLLNPLTIKLPASLGSVKEVFDGKSGKVVFLIQDAHAIPDAQKSIEKLIKLIQQKYRVPLVALEGAASPLDPIFFKAFPDQTLLHKIFDGYLDHGEISGSAAASLFSSSNASYHGIEDWSIYEEGLKFFLDADQNQPQTANPLKVLFNELHREKENSYSKKLLEIDRSLDAFNKNASDLLSTLQKLASVQPPESGSDLALLLQETAMSGVTDLNLETEIRKIADSTQQALERSSAPSAREDLRNYYQNLQDYKTSQMPVQTFALSLKNLALKYRVHIRVSKKMNALVRHQKKLKDIEGTRLFEHYEKYQQTVKEALFRNDREKSLDRRSHQLDLLARLSRLELSSQDWQEIKELLSSMDYWNVTRDGISGKGDIAHLFDLMQSNLSFYRNAETRDQVLHENTRKLMAQHNASTAVLVAGGFHAEGLRQRFQSEGISYVLIMPAIKTIPEQTSYRESMRGEVSWKSYFQIKNGKVDLYSAFIRGTRDQLLSYDSLLMAPPSLLKNWRDQIIRELANQGRTVHAPEYTGFLDELHQRKTDKLLTEWETNINRFFSQLNQLKIQDQLTEKNILRLLSPAAITSPYSIPFARSEIRAGLIPGLAADVIRSEVRVIPKPVADLAKKRFGKKNYLQSGIDFDRTLPVYRAKGIFAEAAEKGNGKPLQEIRKDLDDQVAAKHELTRLEDGYLARGVSPEIDKLYEIFERVIQGYNHLAKARGMPAYRGKLFLVDSPQPNAFVFSEHDDVYQYIGDIQETARYLQVISQETGIDLPLTEELIAMTFAHELGHVFQGSSYHGLEFSQWTKDQHSQAAILDLKRQMEYDADRMAIGILDAAGYSAKPILDWLNFMVRITSQGTAEHAIADHPHPKLRLAHIAQHLNESKLITQHWENSLPHGSSMQDGLHLLDKDRYAELETAHTHHHAHRLNSFEDLDRAAASASSPQQLLEYAALADEKASLTAMKAFAETQEARDVFSKQVYMQNVINLAERMTRQAIEKDSNLEARVAGTETPMNAALLAQNLKAGAHMLEEILATELKLWAPGKEPLSATDREDLDNRAKETLTVFKTTLEAILKTLQDSQLSVAQKTALVQKLLTLTRDAMARLPSIRADDFEAALSETPPDPETIFADFMHSDTDRSAQALEALTRIPLSVYSHYGKTTLDRDAALDTSLFGTFNKPLGELKEEIEDSGLYRSDPSLWELQTPEARHKAYQTSLYAWVHERMAQKIAAQTFRERHSAHFLTLVNESLDRNKSYELPEKSKLDQIIAEHLFKLFFTQDWKSFSENDLVQVPDTMDFFRDAALETGIVRPDESKVSRSTLFTHENGLDRSPVATLKKKETPTTSNKKMNTPSSIGSGSRPRKLYEISGDVRGAFSAIEEDYIKRCGFGDFNLETFLNVLDEHLAVYAPYFREKILQTLISVRNFPLNLNRDDVSGCQLWLEASSLQNIHDWVEQRIGTAGAHGIMDWFMMQVDWLPLHSELTSTVMVGNPRIKTPPMLDLTLEKAREVAAFLEKYYFTGHPQDAKPADDALALKYLNAKLRIYQLEQPGFPPAPGLLFQDLLRLSAHVPITLKFKKPNKVDNPSDANPLEGRYLENQINSAELFEENFTAMLWRNPVNGFEASYFRQIFSLSRQELQQIVANQNRLRAQNQKKVGRHRAFMDHGGTISEDTPEWMSNPYTDDGGSSRGVLKDIEIMNGENSYSFDSLLNALILRRIVEEEPRWFGTRKFQPVLIIRIHNNDLFKDKSWFLESLQFLLGLLHRILKFIKRGRPDIQEPVHDANNLSYSSTKMATQKILDSFSPRTTIIGLIKPLAFVARTYRFRSARATRRFFKKLSEGYLQGSETDGFLKGLSVSWKFLRHFPIFSALLTDEIQVPKVDIEASIEPISYIKYMARQVKAGGVKGELFKAYGRRRRLLDLAGRQSPGERAAELGRSLQTPSTTRDGILDIWERSLVPQVHRHSAITRWRLARITRPALFQSRATHERLFNNFLGDGLIEVPLEWENLETQSLKISRGKTPGILEFYRHAIPLILDPQRQLRYGATAMKIWHQAHPKPDFASELEAIEAFFPKPSQYRDQQLDRLFASHEIPVHETRLTKHGEALTLDEYAERLYATYQRLEYDAEWTHGDAAYQVIQSTLSLASRTDRKDILLWLLDPTHHSLPQIFQAIKEQKNIEFDDLPKHLWHVPQVLKQEILGLLLTGENGLLNSRLPQDSEVKREFSETVVDYFFPPSENDPVKTGIPPEDLDLMREIFATAMDHFEQGRAALMIQDMMSMQRRLKEMPFGERLAFLLSSFGPVGVKIGQFLSENQQLIPSAYLRGYLASLRDNAGPISTLAVLRAIEAAGFPRHRIRLKKLLGSASMKVVYEGEFKNDAGEWVPVVFKVLRPSIGRMTAQDLTVLEKTLTSPRVLAKIKKRLPDFDPKATVAAIRKMIDAERDFEQEKKNAEILGQAVASDPAGARDARGYSASVPKVLAVNQGVIIEEKAQGIEIGKFLSFRTGWKRFFGGTWFLRRTLRSRGLSAEDIAKISKASPSDVIRSLRQRFLHQLFSAGIFHADPHGGNEILGPDNLHFIDPGLIGHFNDPSQWIRTDIDQREAARQLMKAVLIHDAALVIQSIAQLVAAEGGHLKTPATELEARISEVFTTTRGNPGQFLNQLATLMLTEIQAGGNDTFSRFVKAISQGLWMLPMDPLQGWNTLQDLQASLRLSPAEVSLVKQNTIKPYLLKNYLNPWRWLEILKNRVISLATSIYRSFKRRWERLALAIDVLRLRRQVRKLSGMLTPPKHNGESLLSVFVKAVIAKFSTSPAAPVALFFFNEAFQEAEPPKVDPNVFTKIKTATPESQQAHILEAARLHAVYGILLTRVHLNDPKENKPASEETLQARKQFGFVTVPLTEYRKRHDDNYFHSGLPMPQSLEESYLTLLDPFVIPEAQDTEKSGYDPLNRQPLWSSVAETLTRRFLKKKYGEDALDFSIFNEGLIRHWSDTYTDLYLTGLDVLDETRGLLRLRDGNLISRRDMLFQRFQEADRLSAPSLTLIREKPDSVSLAYDALVESHLSPKPRKDQIASVLPISQNGPVHDFVRNSGLRKFLKKQSPGLKEPGSRVSKKHRGVLIFATRKRYSYDRNAKTLQLEFYSVKDALRVSVQLTEAEYYRYLIRGKLPQDTEVTHYENQQTPPPAARSEVRLASQAGLSVALQLMPLGLQQHYKPKDFSIRRRSSPREAAVGLEYLVSTRTISGAQEQALTSARNAFERFRKTREQKSAVSGNFAQALQQARAELLNHLSQSGGAANGVLLSIAFHTKVKKGDPFLTALNQALRTYGNPVELIAEKEFFNALPQTATDRKNRIQKQVRPGEWKNHIVLRSEQEETPLADDGSASSAVLAEMFTGFFLDLSGTNDVLTGDFAQLLYVASLIELAKIYNDPQHKSVLRKITHLKASPLKKAEYLRNALLVNLAKLGYTDAMFSFQSGRLTLVGKAVQAFLTRAEVRKSA